MMTGIRARGNDERRNLRSRINLRPGAGKPATGTPAVRSSSRAALRRVCGPWRLRQQGSPSRPRSDGCRRVTPTIRCRGLLAARPPWSQSQTPDLPCSTNSRRSAWPSSAWPRYRRHHTGRQTPDTHLGGQSPNWSGRGFANESTQASRGRERKVSDWFDHAAISTRNGS
jgi:hypothetical protein